MGLNNCVGGVSQESFERPEMHHEREISFDLYSIIASSAKAGRSPGPLPNTRFAQPGAGKLPDIGNGPTL